MDKINTSVLGIGVGIFATLKIANSLKNKENVEDMNAILRTENMDMQSASTQNTNEMEGSIGTESIMPGIALNEFTSNRYQISFKYPRTWNKNPRYEDKYEGQSGFFEVGDFEGIGQNIDEAVKQQIDEDYRPYGTNPTIRRFVADGQPIRVIYPSADQPDFFKDREAAIVIQYPKPITLDGEPYDYAVIWATPQYIPLIISTLKFNMR